MLVIDAAADPGVVTLARRDARRIAALDMDNEALVALLAEGQQVVWITGQDRTGPALLAQSEIAIVQL